LALAQNFRGSAILLRRGEIVIFQLKASRIVTTSRNRK
jgi:hypothetical protein